MRKRNKFIFLITLVLFVSGIALGRYAYTRGFTKKWREYIIEEFATRGVHLEFEKLTLDPIRGLVAREVTVYESEKRIERLAMINHISLDVDYAGLMGKELFLDSFELKDADLWFQLDPQKKSGERIDIQDFSARVFLTGDRIQIRRAEGVLNGIEVSLRGLFFNAENPEEDESEAKVTEESAEGGFRIQSLAGVVRWLRQLKFDPEFPPQLEIDIHGGDLGRPKNLRGTVHFVGENLQMGSYNCDRVEAILETRRGVAVLKRISVIDSWGQLDGNAEYRFGGRSVKFQVESEANLPGFLVGALDWRQLGGIVFYEPPKISVEGELFLDGRRSDGWPAARAFGRVLCGKIASRGKIFESAQTDFSIDGEHFFLRNLVLEHRTGGFSGEAMLDDNGFRYRANLTLDPRVFEPFCERTSTRDLLQRFDFGRESNVYAEIYGTGVDIEPANWENRAEFELRNFSFDGVAVRKFEGLLSLESGVQEYEDIELVLGDGEATAEIVRVDPVNSMAEIREFSGDVDMAKIMDCFDPATAERIRAYRFNDPPQLKIDGVYDIGGRGRNDLLVGIRASAGMRWPVGSGDLPLEAVNADLRMRRNETGISAECGLFGGKLKGAVQIDGSGEERSYSGQFEFGEIGFGNLIEVFVPGTESGGKMAGAFEFSGSGAGFDMLDSHGQVSVSNGNIFGIPWLGGLSDSVSELIRKIDSDDWDVGNANLDFSVSGGLIRPVLIEAKAAAFGLLVTGGVDLNADSSELSATVEVPDRSGSGGDAVLFKGSGTAREVEWRR